MERALDVRPVRVHHRGDGRVDALLALMRIAASGQPLPAKLDDMCAEARRVVPAEVVSAYVRERRGGRDLLAMRGNVGLAAGVTSFVTLEMGEGITGFAAEHGRPVSALVSRGSTPFKAISGIGEEAFPVYLAVPLVAGGGTAGVLVLQRRGSLVFDGSEIVTATAMASSFAHAIERAARSPSARRRLPRARGVRLTGVGATKGAAVGLAEVVPSFDDVAPRLLGLGPDDAVRAFDALGSDVARVSARVGARAAAELELLFLDRRLREAVRDAVSAEGVAKGLASVARSYSIAPEHTVGPARSFLARRAREVEELCTLVAASLAGGPFRASGMVLLSAELPSRVVLLIGLSRRLSAVVVGSRVDADDPALALLATARVPVVAELPDLFAWARPGDRVIADGDRGSLRVHPTPGELVRLRRRIRAESELAGEAQRHDG